MEHASFDVETAQRAIRKAIENGEEEILARRLATLPQPMDKKLGRSLIALAAAINEPRCLPVLFQAGAPKAENDIELAGWMSHAAKTLATDSFSCLASGACSEPGVKIGQDLFGVLWWALSTANRDPHAVACICETIIGLGSDPNATFIGAYEGSDPLEAAIINRQTCMIGPLLASGAQAQERHWKFARDSLNGVLLGELLKREAVPPPHLLDPILLDLVSKTSIRDLGGESIHALIAAGADPNAHNRKGKSVFELALSFKAETPIMALIDAGSKPPPDALAFASKFQLQRVFAKLEARELRLSAPRAPKSKKPSL